jgi:signal transduction histidine kinase/CheY-like chemotaxis protein
MGTPTPPAILSGAEPAAAGDHALLDRIQRDKLALIGQMASSVAHELSNPLATIVASAQAILAFWPRPGAPGAPSSQSRDGWSAPPEFLGQPVPLRQLREDLELILAEGRRAGEIVHGLLASARHHPPEWCICSLADVVRRAVALSRHHLKLHNISLQAPWFDPLEGYPMWSRMRGDANQLQQVLLNLIINAQQAITGSRGYGAVRITLAPDGPDRNVLTVEDDGPGVPDDLREAIFRPFYTTKPAGKGTGLGLSISAGIIEAHQGEVGVAHREGGGAVFRLVLPSLAAVDRNAGHASHPEPGTSHDPIELPTTAAGACTGVQRVLLVDDEPGIRRSVSRFLRRSGFQVTDVPDGLTALQALQAGDHDVVISDLRMPGLSGEDFFDRVRREFPAMAGRIVFTSGDMQREETQRFLTESGCPSLQKPYELGELVEVLRTLCPADGAPAEARRATA